MAREERPVSAHGEAHAVGSASGSARLVTTCAEEAVQVCGVHSVSSDAETAVMRQPLAFEAGTESGAAVASYIVADIVAAIVVEDIAAVEGRHTGYDRSIDPDARKEPTGWGEWASVAAPGDDTGCNPAGDLDAVGKLAQVACEAGQAQPACCCS